MIDNGTVQVIVDVREPYQGGTYNEPSGFCYAGATNPPSPGHIPEALNYPWTSGYLQAHFGELTAGRPILVVCHGGGRSAAAAQFLCSNGYDPVYNMAGGMLAWTPSPQYPTEQCCFSPADCDDGLFCNGAESCQNFKCQPGSGDPCPAYTGCAEPDICFACPDDYDCDNATDGGDNCLQAANGPRMGTCVRSLGGVLLGTGLECTNSSMCPSGDVCQKNQEDFNANLIGDACECYADCNQDGKVVLSDMVIVKGEFGRTDCASNPCQADMNADNKVLISDLVILKTQFGRSGCPAAP